MQLLISDKWTESILNNYQRYFWHFQSIKITNFFPFSSVYYGEGTRGRSPGGRHCTWPLWMKNEKNQYEPLGFFMWKCSGFLKHDKEHGVLFLGDKYIEALRCNGKETVFTCESNRVGSFTYTPASLFWYLGSGHVQSFTTQTSGFIHLPSFFMVSQFHVVHGMSNNQFYGDIKINGRKGKFLLYQGGTFPNSTVENPNILPPDIYHLQPQENATSIFNGISSEDVSFYDRLMLLFLFCRSIGFYMPGY